MTLVRVLSCPPSRPLVPSPGGNVDAFRLCAQAASTRCAAIALQVLAPLLLCMWVICQPYKPDRLGRALVVLVVDTQDKKWEGKRIAHTCQTRRRNGWHVGTRLRTLVLRRKGLTGGARIDIEIG